MMDESEIPIDIHTSKLMDWLISRRHVPKDWNQKVMIIREKINEAIKDMPEDKKITSLLTGTFINYYHCKRIIDILKETEVNSKNLFGQYTSKRMKDWVEIVKLYEKDNVYLGEVASLLQRSVNYEVPALKKQIAKIASIKSEFDKKENGYDKMADTIMRDFNSTCKSLEIKGKKIKKELIEKAQEFPKICLEVANKIKKLKNIVEFYVSVVQLLLGNTKMPLQALQYVIEHGDTTVYQWKYKKVPSSVEVISLECDDDDEGEENKDDNVIDFGLDLEPVLDLNDDDSIDWGISTVESSEKEEINKKEEKKEKNVAKGEEACTLLGHIDTRNSILNDVLELETFLKVRIYELESESDTFLILPESLQGYDSKTLNEMLIPVQDVKDSLTNSTSLHYLNIMTNQKFVDQLVDKLKQKLNAREKMLASKEAIKVQRAEAIKEAESIRPKIEVIVQKAKELQGLIEEDISKRYKGRPVNLIAGANIL